MKIKIKKGFTLIELLAVIVILAVIALIVTPIVINFIEKATKGAEKSSVNGILNAAEQYYASSLLNENKGKYIDGETNLLSLIEVKGKKPNDGYLYINDNGKVSFGLLYRNTCYMKSFDSENIVETEETKLCKTDTIRANEVQYTNNNTECDNVECALNELYKNIGG